MAVSGIETTLVSIHRLLAARLRDEDWLLEPGEARALAESVAEVNRHYKLPALRPEHVALGQLGGVLLTVYGKRVLGTVAKGQGAKRGGKQAGDVAPSVAPNVAVAPAGPVTPGPASWFPSLGAAGGGAP